MINQLQLLKDLIFILKPSVMLNILCNKLQNRLSESEIAYIIWDISKICPICYGSGFVNKERCFICNEEDLNKSAKYYLNRHKYYKEILYVVPNIWKKQINNKGENK